jgi:hypothetical protein
MSVRVPNAMKFQVLMLVLKFQEIKELIKRHSVLYPVFLVMVPKCIYESQTKYIVSCDHAVFVILPEIITSISSIWSDNHDTFIALQLFFF